MANSIPKKQQLAEQRRKRAAAAARPRLADRGASLAGWAKRRPWLARVYIGGKDIHLGYFASPEEARAAHARAVEEHLGEQFLKAKARL
jgi:hypothetical protein